MAVTVSDSLDGINFDTFAKELTTYTFTNAATAGVMQCAVTNKTVDGIGHSRIQSILITGTLNLTNPTAYYSVKQNAP